MLVVVHESLGEGVVAAENDKAFADSLNFRLKPQVSLKLAAETEGAIPLRRFGRH